MRKTFVVSFDTLNSPHFIQNITSFKLSFRTFNVLFCGRSSLKKIIRQEICHRQEMMRRMLDNSLGPVILLPLNKHSLLLYSFPRFIFFRNLSRKPRVKLSKQRCDDSSPHGCIWLGIRSTSRVWFALFAHETIADEKHNAQLRLLPWITSLNVSSCIHRQ